LGVALAVADSLSHRLGDSSGRLVIDLAELFDPESRRMSEFLEWVAGSDLIIVPSPTYKATYTGLSSRPKPHSQV
jgi:FMN reductase